MVVQMIIIMGLFALLRNPMTYISSEEMYFAIHENFLWIRDLSQPDLWVLPLMAGAATFFSTWLSRQTNPNPQNFNAMMKMMMYFFPIMIVWLARSYPSGLSGCRCRHPVRKAANLPLPGAALPIYARSHVRTVQHC